MKWLAQTTIYRDSVDLLLVDDSDCMRRVAKLIEFEMVDSPLGKMINHPTLELPPGSAQSLMQALWDAGLRPANFSNPSGEINALRKHIEFAEKVAIQILNGAK